MLFIRARGSGRTGGCGRKFRWRKNKNGEEGSVEVRQVGVQSSDSTRRARFYKLPAPSNDNHRAVARRPATAGSRFSSCRPHFPLAIKTPFGSLVRRYRRLSRRRERSPVQTYLYNSPANPVMARKTCFAMQFAERRVIRSDTSIGARVNLIAILRIGHLPCVVVA